MSRRLLLLFVAAAVSSSRAHLFDGCSGMGDAASASSIDHLYLVRADGANPPSDDELMVLSAYMGLLSRETPRLALVKDAARDLPWIHSMTEETTDVF